MSERLSPKPDICYSWENTSPSQEEIEDYLSRIKEEYEREQKENSLERTTGLSYVRFISKSNGRNRNQDSLEIGSSGTMADLPRSKVMDRIIL